MASVSPSLHASRPAAVIDPHRQAEYPILLGDSLRESSGPQSQFFNIQYNRKPKHLSSKQRAVITKETPRSSGDPEYVLTIQESAGETKPYKYGGNLRNDAAPNGSMRLSLEDQTSSLALVFNQEKSAFILEKISAALDFNLTSAPGQSRADIQAYPQLPSSKKPNGTHSTDHKPTAGPCDDNDNDDDDDDDDEADPSNPYDYRHFLEEAKSNAERGLGSRTPIPGGLSGMSSPVPSALRFGAGSGPSTPLHKPIASAAPSQVKKRKISNEPSRDPARPAASTVRKTPTTKPRSKPKPAASSSSATASAKPKPLSKERISDSDEEIGDTITLSRPSTAHSKSASRLQKPASASAQKSGYTHSPHIEVDEAADLVIDMGSPPPAARRRPGPSPFAIARPKAAAPHGTSMLDSDEEEEEEDAEGEPDDEVDIEMREVGPDRADADGDVEDLVLGSPRASTTRAPSVSVSRVGVDVDQDEDEDDELAAELEAALENDDEDGDGSGAVGVGLGISTGGGGGVVGGGEDESEESEEE